MKTDFKNLLPYNILFILLLWILLDASCSEVNYQTQIIANNTKIVTTAIPSIVTKTGSSMTQPMQTNTDTVEGKTVVPTNRYTSTISINLSYTPTIEWSGTPFPTLTQRATDFRSIILYDGGGPSGGGTWIYSLDNNIASVIAQNYFSLGWSPSGKHLILYNDQNLYISKPDGSERKLILSGKNVSYGIYWLNEEWILFDSFNIDNHSTRVDLLNIITSERRSLAEDKDFDIIGLSPTREFWFQLNRETEIMKIANMEGYRAPIQIPGGWGGIGEQRMQFLPTGKTVITEGCQGFPPGSGTSCHIYSSEIHGLSISNIKSIYDEETWMVIIKFLTSPDGKYLAIIYQGDPNSHDIMVSFLNLKTLTVDYKYSLPNLITDNYFWSPDSNMIATPYWDDSTQTGGIQIMDIFTGEIEIVHLRNHVPLITSWRMLDVYK